MSRSIARWSGRVGGLVATVTAVVVASAADVDAAVVIPSSPASCAREVQPQLVAQAWPSGGGGVIDYFGQPETEKEAFAKADANVLVKVIGPVEVTSDEFGLDETRQCVEVLRTLSGRSDVTVLRQHGGVRNGHYARYAGEPLLAPNELVLLAPSQQDDGDWWFVPGTGEIHLTAAQAAAVQRGDYAAAGVQDLAAARGWK